MSANPITAEDYDTPEGKKMIDDMDRNSFDRVVDKKADDDRMLHILYVNRSSAEDRMRMGRNLIHDRIYEFHPDDIEFSFRVPKYQRRNPILNLGEAIEKCDEDLVISHFMQRSLYICSIASEERKERDWLLNAAYSHKKWKIVEQLLCSPLHNHFDSEQTLESRSVLKYVIGRDDVDTLESILSPQEIAVSTIDGMSLYRYAFQGTGKLCITAFLFRMGLAEDGVFFTIKNKCVHGSVVLDIDKIVNKLDAKDGLEVTHRFLEYYLEQNPKAIKCISMMTYLRNKGCRSDAIGDNVMRRLVQKCKSLLSTV